MTKTIKEAAKGFADREYEIGQVDWDALYKGYYHGMKDSLRKQEKDTADTVISGWVARDGNGPNDLGLRVYSVKPKRMEGLKRWNGNGEKSTLIDSSLFPDLTWDDDPIEAELIIKRKKK